MFCYYHEKTFLDEGHFFLLCVCWVTEIHKESMAALTCNTMKKAIHFHFIFATFYLCLVLDLITTTMYLSFHFCVLYVCLVFMFE